jgi:uncharacterized pyridoxamine 5'-phosphate oxidase family protein
MSAGSLVLPYSATGGKPFDFNYVGNFSLDGNVYIVEGQDPYTKQVSMKPTPTNGVPLAGEGTRVQYVDFKAPSTFINSTETPIDAIDEYPYLDTVEPVDDSGPIGPILSNPSTETFQEAAQYANRKVNIFNPSELSKVTSRLITIKYT